MPLQGNDNRSTRSWQPLAAVAPSKSWNSTYAVHYRNPAKRLSRNHEYWLKKASERAEATAQLAAQGLQLQPRAAHTFRNPSLALAFNQPLRNPSSTARELVPGHPYGATMPASLTARPLASSIRDTSVRSHNRFDAHQAQQHYGASYNVSALAMLEGQAAASHAIIPNQATARPHVERVYAARAAPPSLSDHLPRGGYGSTARPQTAHPALNLSYRAPEESLDSNGLYATLSPQQSWTETQRSPYAQTQQQQQQSFARSAGSTGGYVRPELRPAAGYTQRVMDTAAVSRSQTFRPLLNASPSAPLIPAPMSPQRSGAYAELQL